MKYIVIAAFCLICVAIVAACKPKQKALQTNNTLLVRLSQAPCRGTCKAYDFSIFSDKNATFQGNRHIEPLGAHVGTLSDVQHQTLVDLLDKSNFASLENNMMAGARDLQALTLEYQGKTVQFNMRKVPVEVKNLVEYIRSLTGDVAWKKSK